ncbi:MAG: Alkaline phosphatase D [Verrucomicrobia subdivision 3 bacterium]|nr:Alkaline phosphatase D [Limisphaerales bacterium]MCS1417472.1 Alkaline phosphatase D [Limisphaerales bacterium]
MFHRFGHNAFRSAKRHARCRIKRQALWTTLLGAIYHYVRFSSPSRLIQSRMHPTTKLLFFLITIIIPDKAMSQSPIALADASRPKPQMQLSDRDKQYKRIHQFALRLILLLRFDEAKALLEDHLKDHPNDVESHYLMGVWHSRQRQFELAAERMEKAIEHGLPAGRVVAGPRALFRGARQGSAFFEDVFEAFKTRLVHGPLVGNVTDSSASFWVRTASPSTFTIVAAKDSDFSTSRHITYGQTLARNDYTGVARLDGLSSNTSYFYRIEINGEPATGSGNNHQFQTFASPGEHTKFRVAFGGGAGFVPPHERVWSTIEAFDPQALLLFGDNVYIDDPESLIMQRYTYYRRQSRPEWRKLTAKTAVFTIWDDHDFGTNDCWGGPEIDSPFWKPHYVFRTFRENWANPGYAGGNAQPGCWYTFQVGDIDFVMLDCRYYRTNPKAPNPTMLGPVQKEWLKRTLCDLSGTFKVLCSSVPWDFRTKGDSLDTWNGFQAEREELFSFLETNQIEGVLLMSADRHRSDAWRIDRPNGYNLYEFNSSRLTNQHVHKEMTDQGALFSYNKKQSFGLVDFDTTKDDPTATYSVVSIDGEIIHEITVRRSTLSASR